MSIRLPHEIRDLLSEQADQLGISRHRLITEYLTEAATGVPLPSQSEIEILAESNLQLRGLGNLVNQITRKFHQSGELSTQFNNTLLLTVQREIYRVSRRITSYICFAKKRQISTLERIRDSDLG